MRAASAARVGAARTSRTGTSVPNASLSRAAKTTADSESPPAVKNPRCAAGRAPSTSSATVTTRSSASVSGRSRAASSSSAAASCSSSAATSSLPLGVRGSWSSACTRVGMRCGGTTSATRAVMSSADRSGPAANATSVPLTATTAACRMPGWASSVASSSPGSMRTPRTLSWRSVRPR